MGTQKNNEEVLATHNIRLLMNRNKSVNPIYGPSIQMGPVILSRKTQNYKLSLANNTGEDAKFNQQKK
jgi:hypothetical protein